MALTKGAIAWGDRASTTWWLSRSELADLGINLEQSVEALSHWDMSIDRPIEIELWRVLRERLHDTVSAPAMAEKMLLATLIHAGPQDQSDIRFWVKAVDS